VYVGGHQRWMNNPYKADRAGAGAVPREGIAALDPVNGLPLSWNPGRDRGVGAFALVSTPEGLWIGSDTDRIGRYEYHGRIAFMPADGGLAVPESRVGAMPGELYRIGTNGVLDRRSVDGTGFGAPAPVGSVDWSPLPRRVHGQRQAVHRLLGQQPVRAQLRRHRVDRADAARPVRAEPRERRRLPRQERHRHVLRAGERPAYYTLSGDARLLYRYFTPESGVVGAETFVAAAAAGRR
jgi:hypothetical protein